MKIAILVPAFPPKWLAGTEIATYNTAKYLTRRGHEVHVITSLDEGLPEESIEEEFYVHRVSLRKVKFIGIMLFWMKIFLLLKKVNPNIIHVQSIGNGIPALLSKKFLNMPYVVYGRGSDIYIPWLFKNHITKLVATNANAVIALTEDMSTEIRKNHDLEIAVIPNGINLDRFSNLSRETFRKKLGVKDDEIIVTFVGTLRPVKGVKYLLHSMNIISKLDTRTKLMLVGDGEEREHLKNLVEDLKIGKCVEFIGRVPNEKVPEYLVASEVLVLPSLSEGFPVVCLEAMACGLPIVASKVGGLPEIVENGVNGFLVEPKNPEQITEKVLLLLEDDVLRERVSKNNKDKVKGYSWESIVEKLEKLYQNYM